MGEKIIDDDWVDDIEALDGKDLVVDNDSIYSEESRSNLIEDDEISVEEEGFMKGYDEAY